EFAVNREPMLDVMRMTGWAAAAAAVVASAVAAWATAAWQAGRTLARVLAERIRDATRQG
ncbi:MAG TPA: hypothetical protein VIV12_16955, partial [Streptosporangiaceae bacterium]